MKTFSKIVATILAILLVGVVVIGVMEMPVAEEGQELSKAEQVIVLVKTYLNEILATLNLSLGAFIILIFNTVSKQATNTANYSAGTDKQVATLKSDLQTQLTNITKLSESVTALSQKIDIIGTTLTETLLLSDLPVTVREKITGYKQQYDSISGKVVAVAETVETATAEVEKAIETAEPTAEVTATAKPSIELY